MECICSGAGCLSLETWGDFGGSSALTGPEVLRGVDQALFPESSVMDITLTDHRPKARERNFRIEVQGVRKVGSILAFRSPATEVGKKYLFRDRNIWIRIPGLPTAIRVSAKEGFMDSNFANNDLMDTEYSDDYEVTLEKVTENAGRRFYVLRCAAKSEQVAYHAIRMTVDWETFIPRQFEYFARSGMLLKTCAFSELKQLATSARLPDRDARCVGREQLLRHYHRRYERSEARGRDLHVESLRK